MASPLLQRFKDLENKEAYELPADLAKQHGRILERIIKARNQRETPRDEFDSMTYEQAYLSNKRAAMSYLSPKKNDDEVRIVTGTTEKRIELLLNELIGLNLEGEIATFDKDDNLLADVSEIFTDIVKRTEQIEMAREKDLWIFYELLTQPSVFVEELWLDEPVFSGRKKSLKRKKRCERRLIQGVQMYLGDVNLPDYRFDEQPYLVKYARMNYSEAERVFDGFDNFKRYVKPGSYSTIGSANEDLYRKGHLTSDEVEAFWYMSYPDDELQIVVQGIPMLGLGAKYTDEYGDLGGYHIKMVSLKPIAGDFAYGKPVTQSAKTLQALDNETIRNLVRKFRQVLEPPVGIKGGKMFSRDIWNPGSIVHGITKDNYEKLVDHGGVTRSEMAMFDLIEKKVNEFIGTSQSEPLQGKTQVTATEFTLAQKNAMKMLGTAVFAVMRLKEKLTMLRVKNVFANYTKPVDKQFDPIYGKVNEVYARFTLEKSEVRGQEGTKIIQLMDRGLSREEEEDIFKAEEKAKRGGTPFQYKTLNIPMIKNMELYFYANVTAKERESTMADRLAFTDMLNQAIGVSQAVGVAIKSTKITSRFERIWRERDLFEKEPSQMMQDINRQQVKGGGAGEALASQQMERLASQVPGAADLV